MQQNFSIDATSEECRHKKGMGKRKLLHPLWTLGHGENECLPLKLSKGLAITFSSQGN